MDSGMISPSDIHKDICRQARDLMDAKSADYAGSADPYLNFRLIETLGLGTMEQGIIVRMGDKLSRLATYTKSGEFQVCDEKLEDTVVDMINYSIILLAAHRERKRAAAEGEAYLKDLETL